MLLNEKIQYLDFMFVNVVMKTDEADWGERYRLIPNSKFMVKEQKLYLLFELFLYNFYL